MRKFDLSVSGRSAPTRRGVTPVPNEDPLPKAPAAYPTRTHHVANDSLRRSGPSECDGSEQRLGLAACAVVLFSSLLSSVAAAGTLGEISLQELPTRQAAVVRFHTTPAQISAAFADVLPAVQEFVLAEGMVPGAAFSRTLLATPSLMVMEAGLEVSAAGYSTGTSPRGPIEFVELAATTSAAVDHQGPYQELGTAHRELGSWWQAQGLRLIAPPLEYYVTDPSAEPDPTLWLTRLQHPVASREQLEDLLGFMVGTWRGGVAGTLLEESWTPFADHESVGTFRMRSNGQAQFYEFMQADLNGKIVDGLQRPILSLKHFGQELNGWEQPDEAIRFALSSASPTQTVWGRQEGGRYAELIYTRGERSLHIELRKTGGDKAPSSSTFALEALRGPDQPKTLHPKEQ